MALAIYHTRFEVNTYDRNIKLSNFLVDDNDDLVLTNCQQSRESPSTLVPEADGCWDVELVVNLPTRDEEGLALRKQCCSTENAQGYLARICGAGRSGMSAQFGGREVPVIS